MNLEGILSIAGKPGLYKLVTQSRGGIIVESLIDNKRFPVSQANNVSALKDIAIYTYDEEVPLTDVYLKIAEKEENGAAISHKASAKELSDYLESVLPEFDKDRVYHSDLKKLFQWYNILQSQGLIDQEIEGEEAKDGSSEDFIEDAQIIEESTKEDAPAEDETSEEV